LWCAAPWPGAINGNTSPRARAPQGDYGHDQYFLGICTHLEAHLAAAAGLAFLPLAVMVT